MVDEPGRNIADRHEVVGQYQPPCGAVLVRLGDRSGDDPGHLEGHRQGGSWVQCNSCAAGWQVLYYTESVG
jgi:hypothetical protein